MGSLHQFFIPSDFERKREIVSRDATFAKIKFVGFLNETKSRVQQKKVVACVASFDTFFFAFQATKNTQDEK
jgi:hypothetical protein